MKLYIPKSDIIAEIEKKLQDLIACKENTSFIEQSVVLWAKIDMCKEILSFLDTIDVKDVDLIDRKPDWSPSKKQMESLRDLLEYNIGVFDYQKFMEVKSLYDDLTKMVDYKIEW